MRLVLMVLAIATASCGDPKLPDCNGPVDRACAIDGVTCQECTNSDAGDPATGLPARWIECSDETHFGPGDSPWVVVVETFNAYCNAGDPGFTDTDPQCVLSADDRCYCRNSIGEMREVPRPNCPP